MKERGLKHSWLNCFPKIGLSRTDSSFGTKIQAFCMLPVQISSCLTLRAAQWYDEELSSQILAKYVFQSGRQNCPFYLLRPSAELVNELCGHSGGKGSSLEVN